MFSYVELFYNRKRMHSALGYAIKYYNNIEADFKNYRITLTGHSLGGALASYVSINYGVKAYTFCAPSITRAVLRAEALKRSENFDLAFRGMDNPYFEETSNYGDTHIAQLNEDWGWGRVLDDTILLDGEYGLWDPNWEHHMVEALFKSSYINGKYSFSFLQEKMRVSNENVVILDPLTNNGIAAVYGTTKPDEITCSTAYTTGVFAGDGNDRITSGACADRLNGGRGDDTYFINGYEGTDVIFDTQGNDKIVFADSVVKNSITIDRTSSADYYVIKYTSGILQGVIRISKKYPVEKIQFGKDTIDTLSIY